MPFWKPQPKKLIKPQVDLAVTALEGNPNPLDMDLKGIGPVPTSLDLVGTQESRTCSIPPRCATDIPPEGDSSRPVIEMHGSGSINRFESCDGFMDQTNGVFLGGQPWPNRRADTRFQIKLNGSTSLLLGWIPVLPETDL